VQAELSGEGVTLGPQGHQLYDQSGFGRKTDQGLSLTQVEALYLVLKGKVEVPDRSFEDLLCHFSHDPSFLRSFLVYRDIRERGYAVQQGGSDFRVYRRGVRPGKGRSQYIVRVLSERDRVEFHRLTAEVVTSSHMRKQHLLAVVDDEDELTYYELKVQQLAKNEGQPDQPLAGAALLGIFVMVPAGQPGASSCEQFGSHLDPVRLLLPPVEVLHLLKSDQLKLALQGEPLDYDRYLALVAPDDREIPEKALVYHDLRSLGYVPRTGYKFGHHFRVYTGKKLHSEMLVHAIREEVTMPMSTVSRSVRLAHSVKKKMLFAAVHSSGIQYVEFSRFKL
jgi:tRNA-intron endonuclease